MQDELCVRGIVLSVSLLGEYDKRMVVLTEQLGKITIFANGARRKNSRFAAVTQSFTLGRFHVRPGRQSYTLTGAELERSFLDLTPDMERYASASYCCELMDYFTREGVGGRDELNLLYTAFHTLLEGRLGPRVIRSAYAVKLLDVEGEMAPSEQGLAQYILAQPIGRTFSFQATPHAEEELEKLAQESLRKVLDYPLRSEEILKSLV